MQVTGMQGDMVACTGCGTENPAGARFCFRCGNPFVAPCPHCAAPLPAADAGFCSSCGKQLASADDDLMLKIVSVLFCDVVSSTERAERMFPDEVRDLMMEFFTAMTEEIHAEGGRIDKFIGDAVMALFGVPVAREDDAVRAVRAARRMIARAEVFNEGRDPLHQVLIRIGINTGEVLAAADDAQFRVTGDTVNVASRLEGAAPVGRVLIGPRTAGLVRNVFRLTELEPLVLKGKSEPVPAFLVEDETVAPRERGSINSPLVGRDKELDQLHRALYRATENGRAALVVVAGDAGIGKSRLLSEFAERVHDGAGWTSGRCLAYGEGITLWPLAEILMAEAGILLTDPSAEVREKIVKLVTAVAPDPIDLDSVVTGLAATIGLNEVGPVQLDPRELFREIVGAWKVLMQGLARDRPAIVLIEDLHWADATMLEVLRLLVDETHAPLLFIATTRSTLFDAHPEWRAASDNRSLLMLRPLGADASTALVEQLLGRSLPPGVSRRILERSEGNPFFVEEILNHLIDQGLLVRNGDAWLASQDISDVSIPDTVHGVLLARIDLLSRPERRLLQVAAVVGRAFWAGSLEQTAPGKVTQLLQGLEARGLIHRSPSSSIEGEEEYSFKHILIRDVAYETLPRKRRARTHIEVARWIEHISEERVDDLAEFLAHHYREAFRFSSEDEHRVAARDYYRRAARGACGRFALLQGVRHGECAIELSHGPAERAQALEELGDMYFRSISVDGAWLAYLAALEELDGSRPEVHERVASKAALVATRWEKALREAPDPQVLSRLIESGIDGVSKRGCAASMIAKAFFQIAGYEEMDPGGKAAAEQALTIAEDLDDPELASAALDALAYWLMPDGLHGHIARMNRRRIELVPRLSDAREICDAYIVAAWSSLFAGRYADAEEAATACIDRAAGIDPGSYVLGLVERVQARCMLGKWDDALEDQAEIEGLEGAEGQPPGPHAWKAYAFAMLIHELRGDSDSTDRYLKLLQRFDDDANVTMREGPTLRAATIARALIHGGRIDEAEELLNLAPGPVVSSHLQAACDLLLATRRWDEAPETVARARAEAARADLEALPLHAARLEGAATVAGGDAATGAGLLRAAADGFERLQAAWDAAYTRLLLAEVLPGPDAVVEAERALAVLEALDAPAEVHRAEILLVRISE